jgi:hypothetical protein
VAALDSRSIDSKLGMPLNPIPRKTVDNGKNCHVTLQPKNWQHVTSCYSNTKLYMHDATHYILVIIIKNQVIKKKVIILKGCHVTSHPKKLTVACYNLF